MISIESIIVKKPFVIAEVGSNFKTIEDCISSISMAKACGADAVKFQLFRPYDLYGPGVMPWDSVYKSPYLNPNWLPRLKEKADACEIEFMCSAFSPELLDAVNPFVNIHKLASSEMCHMGMLDKLKQFNKPTIISTGAQTQPDMLAVFHYLKGLPIIPLYCEAAYPSKHVNFDVFHRLKTQLFRDYPWGFSDHTLDVIENPRRAVRMGACVIEKHVNFAGVKSADSPHSLSTDEFKVMIKAVREKLEPYIGPTVAELPMLLRHKRRILATRDIRAGETLIEGQNMGVYRSLKDDTNAAHPFMIKEMIGKTVKRDFKSGEGISLKDVSQDRSPEQSI